jgi:hypothetical protein
MSRQRRQDLHPEVVKALLSVRLRMHVARLGLCARAMAVRGMDLDELLQEVAVGVLTRHQGQGRYDPGRCRTAYGYVALVACSVVADLAKPKHVQPVPSALDVSSCEESVGPTDHIDMWDLHSGWQASVRVQNRGGNVIVDKDG